MGRIEAAAEESDLAALVCWLIHVPILEPVPAIRIPDYMHWRSGAGSATLQRRERHASIDFIMRYVLSFLAICGVVVSVLALQVHYSSSTEPCSINEKWDCGTVNHSQFAVVKGFPVAAIGILGYLAIIWFAFAKQRLLLTGAAGIGFAYSLYLAYIEKSVLGVWCLYCVISLGVITLITVLGAIWTIVRLVDRNA